jgi:ABC-type transport system involved in multi-copper enzyme maturation permease subunit
MMKGFTTVFLQSLKGVRKSTTFRLLLLLFVVLCIVVGVILCIILGRRNWQVIPFARHLLELVIGLLLYFLPFTIIIAVIWAFTGIPLTKEKTEGCIESLLAAPVSPGALWAGKSLSVFIPAYLSALCGTFFVICIVNLFAVVPSIGSWIFPLNALITGMMLNPILLLAVLSFVLIIALLASPDIAMTFSFLVGFILMIGMPLGLALNAFNPLSRTFTLAYAGLTLVFSLAALLASTFLKKERIILSRSRTPT